ncbi:putative Lipoate-protein ligase [Glomus cerebriforme]|uniref:lipoyl(octanoyl) transferase n=1 Tax=Glomus cerebriforme TaxID=658196 RepID=A0A397S3F4_9GLOM|nr:putative Lipoate-protein ligase [Glomus cerebriforme]
MYFFNSLQKVYKSTCTFPIIHSNSLVLPYIYLSQITYIKALSLQQYLVKNRIGNKLDNVLLLVQHPPTYTTGRRGKEKSEDERIRLQEFGADYYETLRGGQVTFHGPGQLVGYPILNIRNFKLSVRSYVAALEQMIIDTCATYGIKAKTTEYTGVWVNDEEKLCAIGIQIQRYITSHGFALNCNTDLNWFNHIMPCGLEDKQMTSISKELNKLRNKNEMMEVSVEDVLPNLCKSFGKVFNCNIVSLHELNDEKYLQLKNAILNFQKNIHNLK